MGYPFNRDFASSPEVPDVMLVPLYRVLMVEFRRMPGMETKHPNSLGQFNPNTTNSCNLMPLIARNTAALASDWYPYLPPGVVFVLEGLCQLPGLSVESMRHKESWGLPFNLF